MNTQLFIQFQFLYISLIEDLTLKCFLALRDKTKKLKKHPFLLFKRNYVREKFRKVGIRSGNV